MKLKRDIFAKYIRTLLPTGATLLAQLLAFGITARGLGAEQFGIYTALLAIAAIGVEAAGAGTGPIFVAGVASEPTGFAKQFGHWLTLILVAWPTATLIGTVVGIYVIDVPLPWYLIVITLVSEILVGRASASAEIIFVAFKNPEIAALLRLIVVLARLATACLYFLALNRQDLSGWIYFVAISSSFISIAVYLVVTRKYGNASLGLIKGRIKSGLILCMTDVSSSLQNNIDRMVLARFSTPTIVGAYGAATRVLQVGTFPIQAATRLIYPRFFEIAEQGPIALRQYAMKISLTLAGVGIVACIVVVCGALLLPILLGKDFAGSVEIAAILGLALPFVALQSPAGDALVAAGHQGVRAVIYMTMSVSFGFILAFGAWLGGGTGVGLAFCFGNALLALALWGGMWHFVRPSRADPTYPSPTDLGDIPKNTL